LLSLSVSAQSQAQTRGLSITLSSDAQTLSATQEVMVNVTLTNFSAEPIQVLRWYTPLQPASTGLFKVTRNGEAVDYVGALVKRGTPQASDYVFANQPYRVYLCNAFWAAPNTGTDSRAGTIVHELSHFTVLGGTSDFAYGQTAARRLAQQQPNRAVQNADSHEYFAENTPRQN
jgi:hypothetical protein